MPRRSFWKRRRDLTRTSGPTWQTPLGDPRFTGTTATSPTGIDVVQSSSPSVTEYYIFECPHLSGDSCPSRRGLRSAWGWLPDESGRFSIGRRGSCRRTSVGLEIRPLPKDLRAPQPSGKTVQIAGFKK